MPLRNVPWKTNAKDVAKILEHQETHFKTIPPHIVMYIGEEFMDPKTCWTMLTGACSPDCVLESVPALIVKAVGSMAPSTLTRLAIEGRFGQGAPAVLPPLWGSFMPQAVGPLTVRERALVHVQWARDAFLTDGWIQPNVLPQAAPMYPDALWP